MGYEKDMNSVRLETQCCVHIRMFIQNNDPMHVIRDDHERS